MTVDELIEWLESAKRQSNRDISEYIVFIPTNSVADDTLEDGKVNHAIGRVTFYP